VWVMVPPSDGRSTIRSRQLGPGCPARMGLLNPFYGGPLRARSLVASPPEVGAGSSDPKT